MKPLIKIQGVWPAVKKPEVFYNTFAPIVDLIAFNPLIDYLHNDKDIIYEDNFACPQHYQRIVIGSNGFAAMCSSDDFMDIEIGDANKYSFTNFGMENYFRKLDNNMKKMDLKKLNHVKTVFIQEKCKKMKKP